VHHIAAVEGGDFLQLAGNLPDGRNIATAARPFQVV